MLSNVGRFDALYIDDKFDRRPRIRVPPDAASGDVSRQWTSSSDKSKEDEQGSPGQA